MADTPWQVLLLDPATASERDAKAAYARLLKVHRPEHDPDGFKRVRAAYEAVLQLLAQRGKAPLPEEPAISAVRPDIQKTTASPVAPSMPDGTEEVIAAREALRNTVTTRVRQKIREAWSHFDTAANRMQMRCEDRFRHLLEAFSQQLPLLAELSTDEKLLQHIAEGEPGLPSLVLNQWSGEGDARRLSDFSVSLARARHLQGTEHGAMVTLQLALGLAVWSPDAASRLAEKAYPHLPTTSREALMEAVEGELLLGRVLAPLPKDHKTFWLGQVRGTVPRCGWRDTMSRQMLALVIRHFGIQWPGFAILRKTLPPDNWTELERAAIGMLR